MFGYFRNVLVPVPCVGLGVVCYFSCVLGPVLCVGSGVVVGSGVMCWFRCRVCALCWFK